MKCSNCKREFDGRNFGFVSSGRRGSSRYSLIADICSVDCKAEYKTKAATGNNAGSGVADPGKIKSPRKLSKSEIKRRSRPTERDVSKSIAADLTDSGLWNTRTQSGAVRTHTGHVMKLCRTGTPDRIAAIGLHVWIEVKRQGEKPTPEQLDAIATLRANGALAFVVDDPEQWRRIRLCLLARVHVIDAINADIQRIQKEIDEALAR